MSGVSRLTPQRLCRSGAPLAFLSKSCASLRWACTIGGVSWAATTRSRVDATVHRKVCSVIDLRKLQEEGLLSWRTGTLSDAPSWGGAILATYSDRLRAPRSRGHAWHIRQLIGWRSAAQYRRESALSSACRFRGSAWQRRLSGAHRGAAGTVAGRGSALYAFEWPRGRHGGYWIVLQIGSASHQCRAAWQRRAFCLISVPPPERRHL